MINKYAEIQDRILLYNACKGILRTKLAALEKDAWLGTALSSVPSFLGNVASGLGTVGKYVGTASKAVGAAAAPVVSGINKALTGLNKLKPIADGLNTAGNFGKAVTGIGATAVAAPALMKQLEKVYLSDEGEGAGADNKQQPAAAPAAAATTATQTDNPYPNDEGIDNSDLPPGLDMNSPEVILALLSNSRPITKQQRAIISKYLAQMQQQVAAGQNPAVNQQAGASPAVYANTVTNPAQG